MISKKHKKLSKKYIESLHWSGVVIKYGSTTWCSLQSLLYSADQFTWYYQPLNLRRAFIYLQLTVTTLVKQLFSRTTWVSRYQNVSILDFIGVKADGGSGDNWSYKACKAPVKSSSPTNQHSAYYRPDALPVTQPTT